MSIVYPISRLDRTTRRGTFPVGGRGIRRTLAVCGLLGLLMSGSNARTAAGTARKSKASCVASFEQSQEQRKQGKLLRARELLLSCAASACGKVIARECTSLLDELRPEIPTVLLSLTDERGQSLSDAEVSVDGAPFAPELDARPLSVDPGEHEFVFSTSDGRRAVVRVTVTAGAENQKIEGVLAPVPSLSPAVSAVADSANTKPKHTKRKQHEQQVISSLEPAQSSSSVLPYLFGGVGLVGVGGFVTLTALAKSENQKLTSCWPSCSDARVERVHTMYLAGDISLGVGVAALGTGLILALTQSRTPAVHEQAKSRSNTARQSDVVFAERAARSLDLRGLRGGAFASVRGSF